MYCYQCGAGMTYAGIPPNFCMSCGVKMGDANASPEAIEPPATDTSKASVRPQTPSEEPKESIMNLNIDGLEIEIDIPSNSIPLSQIAGTQDSVNPNDDFKPTRNKKMSKKKFLEEFQKEAGSLRKKKGETNNE